MAGVRPARRFAVAATAFGGVAVIAGSFLPWAASGDVRRSSYDLFELLGRLGYATDGPVGVALRWWPLVPFLVGVSIAVTLWARVGVASAVGVLAAAYPLLVSGAVLVAPVQGAVQVRSGATITFAGALVLLAGSVVSLSTTVAAALRRSAGITPEPTARAPRAPIGAPPAGRS